MNKLELSIVILSYNTKDLLKNCLNSLIKIEKETPFEVIVVDNASTDGSIKMLKDIKSKFSRFLLIENKNNLGFAAGNNKSKKDVKGDYVLFLNSDTVINRKTIKETLTYIKKHNKVGALTCKIFLPNGELDKDARRSFPTPWVSLTHLVFKLDKIFPKSRLFAKYWYGYIPSDEIHEVDVIQGAYFLAKKKVLDQVGWFDEDYFLDGEDIDLCWKIKRKNWKIVYYPKVSITHVKKASKSKPTSKNERVRFIRAGVDSMEIFYKKRLWDNYPLPVNLIVIMGIKIVKIKRWFQIVKS